MDDVLIVVPSKPKLEITLHSGMLKCISKWFRDPTLDRFVNEVAGVKHQCG